MVCLETTFLIDLLKGKPDVASLKDEFDSKERVVAIAAPSVMEIWTGACLAKASNAEREKINELLTSLEVLPLDEKAAKEAGEIEAELTKKGLPVETEDMMIAGIARAHSEKIVTRDKHYANIPGMRILKY